MKHIIYLLTTLILFPITYGSAKSILKLIYRISSSVIRDAYITTLFQYFIAGFILYIILQIFFSKPIMLYIFGHELTHAITGILYGAKIKALKIGKSGGSVTLSKTNIFITLSPYFIPVWTFIIIVLYWLIDALFKIKPYFYKYFFLLIGMSLAFHIFLTLHAISQGQSDLKIYGSIFSLLIVITMNILLIGIFLSILFKLDIFIFLKDIIKNTIIFIVFIYVNLKHFLEYVSK